MDRGRGHAACTTTEPSLEPAGCAMAGAAVPRVARVHQDHLAGITRTIGCHLGKALGKVADSG